MARWCEVRGWIPSVSLACWEGDLEIKHSAPSEAPSHPGVILRRAVYAGKSAPKNTPWEDGGSSPRVGTWPGVLDFKVSLPARETY